MIEQTMPRVGARVKKRVTGVNLVEIVVPAKSALEHAHDLFITDIPENASLAIEETDGKLIAKYIFRMTYTSGKSGRKINVVAKGESLPQDYGDLLYRYYYQQLIMTPTEVARELSRIYFIERRARQDAFLFKAGRTSDGAADESTNIRVNDTGFEDDKLSYEDYS